MFATDLPLPQTAARSTKEVIVVGVLPTFMEARHPELLPVSDPIPEMTAPVWMLTHPDLRMTARVRAFMHDVGDALTARLAAD